MKRRRPDLTPGPSPARRGEDAGGREMLARIKQAVLETEPDATVLLFGSRARGDARPGSDWDVLVLLDGPVDNARSLAVHDRLLEVTDDADESIQAIALSRDAWNSPSWRVLPFHQNVDADGIALTPDGHEAPPVTEEEMAEAREELIRIWLEQAQEAFDDAEFAATGARWGNCVGRLYYACFHAVSALLVSRGDNFSSHRVVESLFSLHFGETGAVPPDMIALYKQLHQSRLLADYHGGTRFEEAEVREWIAGTRRLLAVVEDLVQVPP